MANPLRLIRNLDWDDILGYRTPKYVKIQDRRLGIIYYVLWIAIFVFLIWYLIVQQQGYNEFDDCEGDVKVVLKTKPIDLSRINYCNSSCSTFDGTDTGCNCIFWDSLDLVYPEEEEYSAFFATKATIITQQRAVNPCSGGVCQASWTTISSSGPFNLVGVDQFEISLFHEGVAPRFLAEYIEHHSLPKKQSKWLKKSTDLFGQISNIHGHAVYDSTIGQSDLFSFGLLLNASGTSIDSVRENGGIMRISITYGDCSDYMLKSPNSDKLCDHAKKEAVGPINYYYYSPQWIPATTYSVTRVSYTGANTRYLRVMTGIRLYFKVDGRVGKFSFASLLVALVSVYVVYTVVTFVLDFVVMYIIPGSRLYRESKYERTQNFHDMREGLLKEQNVKKKIQNVTKLARFDDFKKVQQVLEGMRAGVSAKEWDDIALACIGVYGEELLDRSSATKILEALNLESSKTKAHILLGELKEAYLVAARNKDVDSIKVLKEEAASIGNERVKQLCDQFLSEGENASFELQGM